VLAAGAQVVDRFQPRRHEVAAGLVAQGDGQRPLAVQLVEDRHAARADGGQAT
jgi:hypothetical protein